MASKRILKKWVKLLAFALHFMIVHGGRRAVEEIENAARTLRELIPPKKGLRQYDLRNLIPELRKANFNKVSIVSCIY